MTHPIFKAALAMFFLCAAAPALAQRVVVVNGQWMSLAQIEDLERAHCGAIPNGNYVLDFATGLWSAPGATGAANIADNCRASRTASQGVGIGEEGGRRSSE